MGLVRVATCQFPVSRNISRNSKRVRGQMEEASQLGADVAHFPEAALSGYAGMDLGSWDGFDWGRLVDETREIMSLARELGIWVVLGSTHRLSPGNLPHNCLYAISSEGKIVERYDKRFCTKGDLKFYSPGDHFSIFDVNGVRCGMLICYDVRFPEMYRAYKRLGVQLVFHSFYNARLSGPGILKVIMRPTLQARAASNYLWISASNSSAYSSWPSVFVQPDGVIAAQLRCDRPGVMVNMVDLSKQFYDASGEHRQLAMSGILHSGATVDDPRSRDRKSL